MLCYGCLHQILIVKAAITITGLNVVGHCEQNLRCDNKGAVRHGNNPCPPMLETTIGRNAVLQTPYDNLLNWWKDAICLWTRRLLKEDMSPAQRVHCHVYKLAMAVLIAVVDTPI